MAIKMARLYCTSLARRDLLMISNWLINHQDMCYGDEKWEYYHFFVGLSWIYTLPKPIQKQ